MSEQQPKMEKDWSSETEQILKEADAIPLAKAIDKLAIIEKQTRTSADLASNSKVLLKIVQLCYKAKDYKLLNDQVVQLTKKRSLLKQAVTKMIQEVIKYVEETNDKVIKLELIDVLRQVTDGKIFVECERARLTRMLSQMKEAEGKIIEAADLLQELQVETFGSMERREKTEFILEQMRLCLAKKDYTRAQIISRKINIKFFEEEANQDLKIHFYNLMIDHAIYSDHFLKACQHHRQLTQTPNIKQDETKINNSLTHVCIFIILSPFDNEQSDLIHRIYADEQLEKLPQMKDLLKCFITPELMRWKIIDQVYGPILKKQQIFDTNTEVGKKRYKTLHQRIVEHNLRVIAKYYSRITTKKLLALLDLDASEAEEYLSALVVNKTIYARIDRISGIINFTEASDANTVLNQWAGNINGLLDLIVKTTHLIAKEEMVHSITKIITE